MGGDCLNYGCVPSKALLAAAHAAESARRAGRFGVQRRRPAIDFRRRARPCPGRHRRASRRTIPRSASKASACTCSAPPARFTGPRRGRRRRLSASAPAASSSPPARRPSCRRCPASSSVPYLTNETVFDLVEQPRHLLVHRRRPDRRRAGAGLPPARRRGHASSRWPTCCRRTIRSWSPWSASACRLKASRCIEGTKVIASSAVSDGVIRCALDGKSGRSIDGQPSADRRRPPAEHRRSRSRTRRHRAVPQGITVDAGLRTSNRRVYAIGDVIGGLQFTHVAGYHAGIVIRHALFRLPREDRTPAPFPGSPTPIPSWPRSA